jgi:hypothetical protein
MLAAVGHPVAVNPDRELRRLAEEQRWEVRNFRRPVRLRTRIVSVVPRTRPSIAAVAGGFVIAAVLVWVAVRSRRPSETPPTTAVGPAQDGASDTLRRVRDRV